MNAKKHFFRLILVILGLNLTAPLVKCQNTTPDVITLNVENVSASVTSWFGLFDKVIIVSAPGITWLRISANPPYWPAWETTTNVLYDGVPITGSIMICPKILEPTLHSEPYLEIGNTGIRCCVGQRLCDIAQDTSGSRSSLCS